MRIARLLKRIDCPPAAISQRLKIEDFQAEVGSFNTDEQMLARLRAASGITETLVTLDMLPPVLQHYRARLKQLPRTKTDRAITETWNDLALVPDVRPTAHHTAT